MIRNLYIGLVVLIRLAGLYLVLSGVFGWSAGLVMTRGTGLGLPMLALLLPIVGGLLLWFLAKPFATLITRDLE